MNDGHEQLSGTPDANPQGSTAYGPEPLRIRFFPPAFIQRRAFVLFILRSLQPKCTSLLDVGTGDGGLLSYLIHCDDDVPISKMVGIDPDQQEIDAAVQETKPSTSCSPSDLRWRSLKISLYRGGIAEFRDSPGKYDVITAIEVFEHLDPPDVEALCRVCLGELRPRCCIFTTPNRDFNEVFDRIGKDDGHNFVSQLCSTASD